MRRLLETENEFEAKLLVVVAACVAQKWGRMCTSTIVLCGGVGMKWEGVRAVLVGIP